ncbi:MAG: DegT/DnrJ/EryC1/StrS family aminotransferase [Chloroflexota bacterium]
MKVPFVDLRAQYATIKDEAKEAVMAVMERGDFVLGGKVKEFEGAFAEYSSAKYGVGVDNGYSALKILVQAYDIGPGDEVITAANTFIATTLAISNSGATPVLVDMDPKTYNIDPAKIEEAITPKTKAIMPVHLYGQPADMGPIMEIAEKHNLVVIEDASQAHGSRYKGQRVGSLGHASGFSLYPGKNLGGYGDAGIITTDDPAVEEKCRMLRNLGMKVKYHHDIKGFNHRLDTMQAAVLCVKLPHLDSWSENRRQAAAMYTEKLQGANVVLPHVPEWAEPVFHLYVIQVEDRDGLQKHLNEAGVASGIHYPIPIHMLDAYKELPYGEGSFPETETYAKKILSLPMYPEITEEMIDYTVEKVKEFTG